MTSVVDKLTEIEKGLVFELTHLLPSTVGTFNSIQEYIEQFPYLDKTLTKEALEEIIKSLVEKGALMDLIGPDVDQVVILPSEAVFREVHELPKS